MISKMVLFSNPDEGKLFQGPYKLPDCEQRAGGSRFPSIDKLMLSVGFIDSLKIWEACILLEMYYDDAWLLYMLYWFYVT